MPYENKLYPAEIIEIMNAVLAGNWDGPNPEQMIDDLLSEWIRNNIYDPISYASLIGIALKQQNCLDIVIARFNLLLLSSQDNGDTIIIKSNRIKLLPGELIESARFSKPSSPTIPPQRVLSRSSTRHFFIDSF